MFGGISNDYVSLNPAGEMVNDIWSELPTSFRGVTIDNHVVMPNHVHVLIGIGIRAMDPLKLTSLIDVVHWYKSLSTTRYIRGVKNQDWPRFNRRLWQQGFHDHIVRNDRELEIIRRYIVENPKRWEEDTWRN